MKSEEFESIIDLAEQISIDTKKNKWLVEKINSRIFLVGMGAVIVLFAIILLTPLEIISSWYLNLGSFLYLIFLMYFCLSYFDRRKKCLEDIDLDLPRLKELLEMADTGIKDLNKDEISAVTMAIFEMKLKRLNNKH